MPLLKVKTSCLALYAVGITIFLSVNTFKSLATTHETTSKTQNTDPKTDAYNVLKTKCNVCHVKSNPRKVFNLNNMEVLAPKIYRQVFVKKRMPKGTLFQLTTNEYKALENWLISKIQ